MMMIRKLLAVIISFFVLSTASFSVVRYTKGSPIQASERQYSFDDSRLLIGGYFFNTADCSDEQFEYIKQAGIDYIVAYPTDEFLDKCQEYDIGVIGVSYNIPANCNVTEYKDYWMDTSLWNRYSPTGYRAHPALWGDLMIDEPRATCFEDLNEMLEVYYNEAATRGKMPYINLFPAYAEAEVLGVELKENRLRDVAASLFHARPRLSNFGTSKYADRLVKLGDFSDKNIEAFKIYISDYINKVDTDYISLDIYPLKKDDVTDGTWLRSLDIVAEACRETNRYMIVTTQAAGLADGNYRYADSFEDINWQSMISLSFGARAIIHGCYYSGYIRDIYMGWWDQDSHCIDAEGNRTATYYAVQQSNEFVKSFAEEYVSYDYMGAFLTNPYGKNEGMNSGYLSPVKGDKRCSVSSDDSVLVGCFSRGEERAYTFVNLESTRTDLTASVNAVFENASQITVYTKDGVRRLNSNSLDYTLQTQEGIFVTVR